LLASCSTAASLTASAPHPQPQTSVDVPDGSGGATQRQHRRRGRHRQQHHGTTSNLSENCFNAFTSGMESWTRAAATAAHTATTALRSAVKAEKSRLDGHGSLTCRCRPRQPGGRSQSRTHVSCSCLRPASCRGVQLGVAPR
jgi:hypothetical protein